MHHWRDAARGSPAPRETGCPAWSRLPGHADLAEIVEQSGYSERADVARTVAQRFGKSHRQERDVIECVVVY